MKITVKDKHLNVRVGQPSLNAPSYQYLSPGSEIEVETKLYPGDEYKSISTWYRDAAGNYYWSGGVHALEIPKPASDNWWITDYGIQALWNSGLTGKGIKVAVLDTGVAFPHPDLDLNVALLHDVTQSATGYRDMYGHGTHCLGIIKSRNNTVGATGIAYGSDVLSCKVTHDKVGDDDSYLCEAIRWAISQNADIISISKGGFTEDPNMKELVASAVSKGILVVAAAGNIEQGYPHNDIYFPARFEQVLSVGAVDKNRNVLNNAIISPKTKLYAPGKDILSTYTNNGYCSLSGSSQATPFVAAVAALLLEKKRRSEPAFKASALKEIILAAADNCPQGKIINVKNL